MIAVDTSALMAILFLEEPTRPCATALQSENDLLISAGTLAEALIVAARRNVGEELGKLVDNLDFEGVPVTLATARRIEKIYLRWGKGIHPASLNLGDCFAYDVAKEYGCRLLYVGDDFAKTDDDFAKTDIESVL